MTHEGCGLGPQGPESLRITRVWGQPGPESGESTSTPPTDIHIYVVLESKTWIFSGT